MKISKFEVIENEDNIQVYVEIPHEGQSTPRFILETHEVTEELEKRGFKFTECISPKKLKNWRDNTRKGTWVFSKKVLDKPVEDVILREEKEVKPKPTKKRRTKSSIKKKVSTGE
tara:strand:+ start:1256 stop:1600 length:345 start_codon:yes stop_codon:yes gene_type:complete